MSVEERTGADEALGTRAASGVLWLAAQKWVVRASGFVTLIVLTRHVSPQEFGVAAAAMTVIPTVYLLSDLGFSTYLLQTDELDHKSLSTAFWASVAAGVLLSSGLVAIAPLLAAAFRTPQLVEVLRVLVLAIVPTVLAGVPLALLRRAMAFRTVALQSLVAAVLAQAVAIVTAVLGGGVWALVSQVVVTQWVIGLLAWRSARWLPSLSLSPQQFRIMAVFGIRVSGVDLVATMRLWAENWIIAVTLGTTALGLFSIGQRLVLVAQELIAASMVPVSTVVFAKVRESMDRLRATYLKALGVAYAVVSPVMILLVVAAPVLIPFLFGDKWAGSVRPAQALAVAGIITLGAMLDHGLFYGLGRPGRWLSYSVVTDAATVATTAVAVRWGLTGVAIGFVGVAAAATAARWVLVGRLVDLPARAVARPFLAVLVPTSAALAVGSLLLATLSGSEWPIVALLATGVGTVAMNVLALRLLAGGIVRDALSVLPLPRAHARRAARLLRFGTD
ncbi:MAG TPA: oligosaccharide flippase family protein [Kineosporiaceae bacterium]|nr:oligosaccharide flippase family protein [Kineosporiaceae bacterium]